MKFGAPYAFFLLILVPVFLLLRVVLHQRRLRRWATAGDWSLLTALTDGYAQFDKTRHTQTLFFALAWILMCVALARPQLGMRTEIRHGRGMDVVIALDLSRSMHARDVVPSRLKRAKIELGVLLDKIRGDRAGLIGFTSIGLPLCPLTIDHAALRIQLTGADPGDLPRGGTSIASAIRAGIQMLASAGHPDADKAIVVLTDGEAHIGDPIKAAEEAAKANVVVHVAGVGSLVGEPIPILDENGQVSGYIKDRKGNTVVSRLDETTLRAIAQAGNGQIALPSGSGGLDLEPITRHLASLQKAELDERTVQVFEERFIWVLVPSFLCLLIATLLRPTRPTRLPRIVLSLGLSWLGWTQPAHAQALLRRNHPKVEAGTQALQNGQADEAKQAYKEAEGILGASPELSYNQALADAAREEFNEAIQGFKAASSSENPQLRARAQLGLGNALRQLKKYDEAAAAYRSALLNDPKLSGAQRNLELTQFMKAIQEAQPPSENEGENDPSDQDNEDKKQEDENEGEDGQSPEEKENQEDDQPEEEENSEDNADDSSEEDQDTKGSDDSDEDTEDQDDGEDSSNENDPDADAPDGGSSGDSPAEAPEEDLSRQEAEAILDALQAEEKALERKRLLEKFRGRPVEKDW